MTTLQRPTGLAMIAVPVLFMAAFIGLWLWSRHPTAAAFAATFGILAGLVQGLGLLRWVVLVPSLASSHADPATVQAVFDAFHLYAGAGIGEHFGYLFTALWTISVAVALVGQYRLLTWAGVVLAIGIATGMAEPFGLAAAGPINAIAYTLWAVWLVVLGVVVLRERSA